MYGLHSFNSHIYMNYPTKNSINNKIVVQNNFIEEDSLPIFHKLIDRDISDNTKKALISDLKHFIEWYVKLNKEAFCFTKLVNREVIAYKRHCQEKYSARTVNRRLASIKALCKLALKEDLIKKDPSDGVKQLPVESLFKSLTAPEWRALLKEAELIGYLRDILILEILFGAGLRASEVINIRIKDIEISDRKGLMQIRHSKGGKSREVPLNQRIRKSITEHKQDLQYFNNCKPEDYLFQGQRKSADGQKRLNTPLAINKIVGVYAKKAGIKCSPHSLRHTFAYNYLKSNPGDIVGLQKILGHSNLNTTAIYTQHRLEDLQANVEKMQY